MSEIVLDRVSKAFAGRSAVENLSLTIARGEIVALVGRTGAGKSTALSLMMGAFPPDHGHVRASPYLARDVGEGRKVQQPARIVTADPLHRHKDIIHR